ncbi:unnamed protein product [Leuciscus chuanchicus]
MASYIPQFNFASLPVGPARIRARCHHASSELASAVPVKESGRAKGTLFGATTGVQSGFHSPPTAVSSRPFREEAGMEDCFRRKGGLATNTLANPKRHQLKPRCSGVCTARPAGRSGQPFRALQKADVSKVVPGRAR